MKNVLFVAAIIFIIFVSCDEVPQSTKVNVGFSDPTVVKIHIAIFDGSMDEENLVLITSISSDNTKIEVPGGKDLTFLFVSENTDGQGQDYGILKYVDTSGSSTMNVSVDMLEFGSADAHIFDFIIGQDFVLRWNHLGATRYTLIGQERLLTGGTGPAQDVYSGPDNYFDVTSYVSTATYDWYVVCYYSFFELETIESYAY